MSACSLCCANCCSADSFSPYLHPIQVSGCRPSQGVTLQKLVAVAARLSQQPLQARECRTLTAILAAALPAAFWMQPLVDTLPDAARGSPSSGSRVPMGSIGMPHSVLSNGNTLNLPRFTRLLTQISLFGLEDTPAAPLTAEGSFQGGRLSLQPLGASPSRSSLEGSPSAAWSPSNRRTGSRRSEGLLKGEQLAGEISSLQVSPDAADSAPVPVEDWVADSLPPGYLDWVQSQHSSAMWLWQQEQLRKVSCMFCQIVA